MIPKNIKILIAEDEPIIYRRLEKLLKDNGYDVIETENNKIINNYYDAIRLIKNNKPDVAILDINIKGEKNGFDIAAYIREHYNTFIIMLTGIDTDENKRKANAISADSFIVKIDKPYHERQLLATIETAELKIKNITQNKELGANLFVKEMKVIWIPAIKEFEVVTKNNIAGSSSFIKWDDILFIEAYNAKKAANSNNNILIYTAKLGKAYMVNNSLSSIEIKLPEDFVRYDNAHIINMKKVTKYIKFPSKCCIDEKSFNMSENYKAKATKKIEQLLLKNH